VLAVALPVMATLLNACCSVGGVPPLAARAEGAAASPPSASPKTASAASVRPRRGPLLRSLMHRIVASAQVALKT
jgi:hypothetical protein